MTTTLPSPNDPLDEFEPESELDEGHEEDSAVASRPRQSMHETAQRIERVILVGVPRPPSQRQFETDEHLEELELLTKTAGAEVVEKVFQSRSALVSSTFIGKGKAEYIAERCKDEDIQTVIFDDDLTPVQQRNLERMLDRKVVDRTALILDIFALHARSNTAKTQVELAQLEYLLPRLTRLWTHLSKQYGGIRTKGPGETQIETDRRLVRDRISHLKEKLELISRQRETQRKGRKDVTRIALVGYTNVGKSTLLNILTGSDVLVEDKLFATLDATVRAVSIGKSTVLFTDTVGFIRKLPPKLVASFKSTLDEVVEADIILHVVDISHPAFQEQIEVVDKTLKDIHADGKPTITVLNKVDTLENAGALAGLAERYPNAVPISAARGINLNELLATIQRIIEERRTIRSFKIRPPDFKLLAEFHRESDVQEERFEDEYILVRSDIAPETAARILKLYAGRIEEAYGDD